jgi:hypothetical protein
MQQEWAKRWVNALNSGRYSQTRHCLRDGTGYDPLGVLADISGLGYYSDVPVEEGEEHKPRGFLDRQHRRSRFLWSRPSVHDRAARLPLAHRL